MSYGGSTMRHKKGDRVKVAAGICAPSMPGEVVEVVVSPDGCMVLHDAGPDGRGPFGWGHGELVPENYPDIYKRTFGPEEERGDGSEGW